MNLNTDGSDVTFALPDECWMNIFSCLPKHSYLPIAHVCKRFRYIYLDFKRTRHGRIHHENELEDYLTNPMCIGNLFAKSWKDDQGENNRLNMTLLQYYVDNGYGAVGVHQGRDNYPLKKVMLQTASRGDIAGMMYMLMSNIYKIDDEDIPSTAAAAGQLNALKWLRGEAVCYNGDQYILQNKCKWNAADAHREAAENCHEDVVEYIEKNSHGNEIHLSYGVGLPW